MRRLGKKGTEKPIEIFVALFVILAVALVMLKLFQNQITQKQTELQTFQQEQKAQELKEKATLYCQDKCNQASNDGCSLRTLASLCISYGSDAITGTDYLDLNNNGRLDRDTTQLPGIGICEDAVPCHALISTCCGRQLNGATCDTILREYWGGQALPVGETVDTMIAANVFEGDCGGDTTGSTWWDAIYGGAT